ncbi:mucin-7-like isoform X2 [Corticium candelabrum]|uniref:mucin-7-like isoform X2 n=1 Tax=Corticium candelabrum TaxID=121492 RepID=UPI002E272CEC|nr:mucin-7-like isoform X2 [Corticium candelabrum]
MCNSRCGTGIYHAVGSCQSSGRCLCWWGFTGPNAVYVVNGNLHHRILADHCTVACTYNHVYYNKQCASLPETRTAAPQTTTAVPQSMTAAPQTTTAAPRITTAAARTTTAAPQTTTVAPQTTTAAPQTTTAAQYTTTAAPQTTTVAPQTTTAAPHTTTAAPHTTTAVLVPHTGTAAPKTVCPTFTLGAMCSQMCNCSLNSVSCNNVSGKCNCALGYKGL